MPVAPGSFLIRRGDDLPEAEQIGHVARELAFGAVAAGGADDEANALGRVQFKHDVAQPAAGRFVLDLPRNADPSQRGHQHQISAGNADVGRKRGPLRADAFLNNLHQHLVATAEDFLNGRFESRPAAEAVVARPLGLVFYSFVELVAHGRFAVVLRLPTRAGRTQRLGRVVAALAEVLRLDVADV
jgi:hypothetical protein